MPRGRYRCYRWLGNRGSGPPIRQGPQPQGNTRVDGKLNAIGSGTVVRGNSHLDRGPRTLELGNGAPGRIHPSKYVEVPEPNGSSYISIISDTYMFFLDSGSLCHHHMSITHRHTMYSRIRNVYGMCTVNLITMLERQKED